MQHAAFARSSQDAGPPQRAGRGTAASIVWYVGGAGGPRRAASLRRGGSTMNIELKRIYDDPKGHDGYRVLVDRLWPRGLRMSNVEFDLWLKDLGPSDTLRKWFAHDPHRWEDLRRY